MPTSSPDWEMPATASSAPAADRRALAESIGLALVVGAMAAVMFASRRDGHWWGDDWALYLRQADGLVSGHPGRVLAENEFTVQMSRGAPFSPPLYPWGFPLVLAPFVALWGTDVDRLVVVPILSACAFACAWYLLARRRIGPVPALLGTVAITISPLLLGWTELIQSEWTFMAVATGGLVALDRSVADGRLLGPAARLGTGVALGLWAAAAFSVRREGVALVAAIGAAQLAGWWRLRRAAPPVPVRSLVVRAATPHAVAGAVVLALQLVLPTTVVPRYDGTTPFNLWRYRADHVDHVLEIIGVKRPWDVEPTVLGQVWIGWLVAVVTLVVLLAGTVWAVRRAADVHLVVYAAVALVIGGSFRVPVNRYLCTVAPVLLLLGATALSHLLLRTRRPWLAPTVVAVCLGAIVVGDVSNAHLRIDRAAEYAETGRIEWGPTHPRAVEMFEQVRALTEPGEVVAAPKARAMTFATGRLAVQVDDHRPIPDLDIALVVTEASSELRSRLLVDPRYVLVWSNDRFSIFAPR